MCIIKFGNKVVIYSIPLVGSLMVNEVVGSFTSLWNNTKKKSVGSWIHTHYHVFVSVWKTVSIQ